MDNEARYYKLLDREKIQCLLCPHNCVINEGHTGICGVRLNQKGKLNTLIYGAVSSMAMDPIEKKPLYHFYPGSNILSIGTKGCNFKCSYCQNWHISQDLKARTSQYTPEEIVHAAQKNNSIGIAYTYSEPMIWFEYVLDCSKLARSKNLKNVLVTNGFINKEPLSELLEYTDALNIDLKSFSDETYKKNQKGRLANVLETIEIADKKCHVEITTLIVTGMNDNINEMKEIIDWISSLNRDIPWHISRYHPSYRYDAPATDIDFILRVYDEAVKKLNHVFCGNISGSYGRGDTVCPSCRATLVSRTGYFIKIKSLKAGKCEKCGHDLKIPQ